MTLTGGFCSFTKKTAVLISKFLDYKIVAPGSTSPSAIRKAKNGLSSEFQDKFSKGKKIVASKFKNPMEGEEDDSED